MSAVYQSWEGAMVATSPETEMARGGSSRYKRTAPPLLLRCCLMLALSIGCCSAKRPSSAPAVARKEDLPFIKCEVCNAIATQLSLQVAKKREQIIPKQLSEYEIIEIAENMCNMKRSEGDWILHQDIVEQGEKLVLVEHEEEGECNTECKTIEKACQEVMGYHDTDISEFLFKKKADAELLSKVLCKDLSRVCHGKIPPLPKDRVPGEAFAPKSSKDAEIERIMRSMSGMPGAPGMKVYSKDDLMNGMPNFNEDDEDEDEEDEEVPAKRFSGGAKGYSSNKHGLSLMDAVKYRAQAVIANSRKHVKKASDWVQNWWSGKSKPKYSEPNSVEL